jgi:alpha-beta hydrolase superfamily lysophospholipase
VYRSILLDKLKLSRPAFYFQLLAILCLSAWLAVAPCPATVIEEKDSADSINAKLPLYEWTDSDQKIKAIVVTVHGATQEAACFEVLAKQLAQKGFLVCSLDLRGHGQWRYKPDEFGSGYTVNYHKSVLDIEHLFEILKRDHPDLPIYAIGESCGAAALVNAAAKRPSMLQGIILASAGTHPRRFKPDWVLPDCFRGLKNYSRPLEIVRYIKRYSSEDPRITKEMITDPLSRRTLSGKELLATGIFIHSTPRKIKGLSEITPLLLLQGTDDNVVSPTSVKQILKKKPGSDKQLVYLPHSGHVLLGTSYIKPQVSRLVLNWLQEHNQAHFIDSPGPVALQQIRTERLE